MKDYQAYKKVETHSQSSSSSSSSSSINWNWLGTHTDVRISREGHLNSYYNCIPYVQRVRDVGNIKKDSKILDVKN